MKDLWIRAAGRDDFPVLDEIRAAAFKPVFASFRSLLGDTLYERIQARDDQAQSGMLASMLDDGSGWSVYVAELEGQVVGFVAVQMNLETRAGEIGLNAVHPDHTGNGIGTAMYEFALKRMRDAGMTATTVATGGDESHAPARKAYEKVGFTKVIPSVWMSREL